MLLIETFSFEISAVVVELWDSQDPNIYILSSTQRAALGGEVDSVTSRLQSGQSSNFAQS